jgi:hypothetical protein
MSLVNVLGEMDMKKIVIFLVLAALITGGAFAQMSVGGGVFLDMSFGNGTKNDTLKMKSGSNNTSFGGFIFFDANYVEVDVGFAYGSLKGTYTIDGKTPAGYQDDGGGNALQLDFSVLGKYPINLGSLTVFPLVGINYNVVLSIKGKGSDKFESKIPYLDNNYRLQETSAMAEFSQFGLLAGVGLDVPFSNNLFFRAEALLNMRFASKSARESITPGSDKDTKTTLGFGPRIKIGIGFRF